MELDVVLYVEAVIGAARVSVGPGNAAHRSGWVAEQEVGIGQPAQAIVERVSATQFQRLALIIHLQPPHIAAKLDSVLAAVPRKIVNELVSVLTLVALVAAGALRHRNHAAESKSRHAADRRIVIRVADPAESEFG